MRSKASFASSVCGSDSFTTMPWDTQAIYYQLCFECDVDGFLANARRVIAGLGLDPTEQLKRLVDAELLLELEHGYLITHYWFNNKRDYKNYKPGNHLTEIAAYLKKHTSCVYELTQEQLDSLNLDCEQSEKSLNTDCKQSLNQNQSYISINSNSKADADAYLDADASAYADVDADVATTISSQSKTPQWPELDEARAFALGIGMDENRAYNLWHDCHRSKWRDKNGNLILDWRGYFRRCKQNDDAINE